MSLEIMAIRTSQMMTSRSLISLLENQNGDKLQIYISKLFLVKCQEKIEKYTRNNQAITSLLIITQKLFIKQIHAVAALFQIN
jgi:hypothetical protein